ncbi:MAG: FAD-binding oxidoreductase [Microgenomates group bacterium]
MDITTPTLQDPGFQKPVAPVVRRTPPARMTVKFADKKIFNDKFIQFAFELTEPHRMPFLAGQYVSIQVAENGDRRSYSICSSPSLDHRFDVLVDISPQGVGSKFLENLEYGASVDALGPMGGFTISQNSDETELVLIATGSGISPMRSIVLDQLQVKNDKRKITLYWGMRYVEELFWQDEFAELVDTFDNFSFHPVISKAVDGWTLCRGRVTDCLSVHQEHDSQTGYYLCGNQPMIHDVLGYFETKGIDKKYQHHEKFY